MRPWPTRGCAPWGKREAVKDYTQFWLFKLTNYVAAVHISYIFVIKYSDVTIKNLFNNKKLNSHFNDFMTVT
jgi:hypothetical protein